MSLIEGWLPPTRENWETITTVWQLSWPVFGSLQYVINWYGMGKTSVTSRLNIPGRLAWFLMEIPGVTTLLYIMNTLPRQVGIDDLPWQNKVLAGLFTIHYAYRAVLFPILQPSMSPIHVVVSSSAVLFQLMNATCLGSYLAAYGPTTASAWDSALGRGGIAQFVAGIAVFYVGLTLNYFHDEELREIRRTEQRRQAKIAKQQKLEGSTDKVKGVNKHYRLPDTMLFRYMLYPHYFCEWVEWFGFWMASGWSIPGRAFFLNEIFVMFPRARSGRRWYVGQFGEEKVGKKWTIIPGVY
ncbi:3-oxo-5-alpha-steroid 4-dehydrogenase [Colletotrichum acutatum]|uniref:3-oxo-5-alpha-steroid 4-dehydrogenase n=1 Tax=Glomerella acutata TaxID=27357 RepID=A0AAD8UHG0_GLOAC|nr:3-oxo-5-alpha-steroid 4-dehydrogenase [Colletotrichum acutatum]KAK1716840.1 3-oxo-5-alpha-steroid 4-dehydrogenase [Colletotrichum acutatum]